MRAVSRWLLALPMLGLVAYVAAADLQTKGKKEPDKNVNTLKTLNAGQLTGKITAVIESKRSLRLQVTLQVPVLNPGAAVGLQQAQMQMARARSRQDVINARMALMQNQAMLYSMQSYTKDIELQASEDVVVRMANPPPKFDDKGKVQKYTAKELKALRGDSKEPGFPATFSDLTIDQVVSVSLVKKKTDPPRKPAKGKSKEVDPDALLEALPQVSMIYILVDPAANTGK